MTINEMTIEQRMEARKEFRPLLEWIKNNTPYRKMDVDDLLSQNETWWNEIAFSMTPEELLSLCRSSIR